MKKRKGFTIVELIIVISILGVLAVVYLPRFAGATDEAKKAADRSSAATIAKACEMYYMINGMKGDDVPKPDQVVEAKLIDRALFKPKYNADDNLGFSVKISEGQASVYYSSDEVRVDWGSYAEGAEQLFPVKEE